MWNPGARNKIGGEHLEGFPRRFLDIQSDKLADENESLVSTRQGSCTRCDAIDYNEVVVVVVYCCKVIMETTDLGSVLGIASGVSASVLMVCIAIGLTARFRHQNHPAHGARHRQTPAEPLDKTKAELTSVPHDTDDPDIIINSNSGTSFVYIQHPLVSTWSPRPVDTHTRSHLKTLSLSHTKKENFPIRLRGTFDSVDRTGENVASQKTLSLLL